ncbi:MAG: histone deacetylase family protein [Alphaproteobacteria bacterium]|nr:histone deacetylase family protein [Alphaproteobacteria bacterium]MCW5744363.1 histone deacetylase family protein [Alphaproteobacteria bacterium]
MATYLFTHPACLGHDPGEGHPERPARLASVLKALSGPEFAPLQRREAPLATTEQLSRAHPPRYVEAVLAAFPSAGYVQLDGDTVVSPGSKDAALRAAGALVAATDAVMGGEASNAFCAVRPPGHHAEPTRPMGFCLFNNVVVAARHARARHGIRRVAVMDFDVHHGNGTETQSMADADLFYASTHQSPLYPGSGMHNHAGHPNIVNAPLPPRSGSAEFRAAVSQQVLPAMRAFAPEMVLVSAGFDAHHADPLAELRLTEEDFGWATEQLLQVAREHAGGRLVSALEGGYDLDALGRSAQAHVRALMAA